jgi:hypothetical protein
MIKKLEKVSTKHLNQPKGGQSLWYRNDTAEIYLVINSENEILSFHIKDHCLNLRYQIHEQLKAGKIDDLNSITDEGNIKPPASSLIRNESAPSKEQVAKGLLILASTPELEPKFRDKIIAILQSTDLR